MENTRYYDQESVSGSFGTVRQAAKRYSLGRDSVKRVAAAAGAAVRLPGMRILRIDFDAMDRYMRDHH